MDISTKLTTFVSVPDLHRAHIFVSEKLKGLQETLSAPQLRYQRYVREMSDLAAKKATVIGEDENPKPGTIKDIESRIRYIENDLAAKREENILTEIRLPLIFLSEEDACVL